MMPQSPPLMSISILQVDPLISSTSPQPLQLICTSPQAALMAATRASLATSDPTKPYNPMTPYAETQKERRKNSRQSIRRIPKDSGVAQETPRGTFSSTIPPIYSNLNTLLTS
jgi:hypothetical protein